MTQHEAMPDLPGQSATCVSCGLATKVGEYQNPHPPPGTIGINGYLLVCVRCGALMWLKHGEPTTALRLAVVTDFDLVDLQAVAWALSLRRTILACNALERHANG